MPAKTLVFNSWKEIANYLGKGVRTVQRWEAKFDLPVQRLAVKPHGMVRATKEDLDEWLSTHWKQQGKSPEPSISPEVERLRRKITRVLSENARLKRQLEEERVRAKDSFPEPPHSPLNGH